MKNKSTERPETIENRWDILYRDYPEVYEEFAKVKRTPAVDLGKVFGVKGKTVVDVGAGTGTSTFAFAIGAKKVIGIEPEKAMLNIARQNLKSKKFPNVIFKQGSSGLMPLPDHSADLVVAVTAASLYSTENITAFTYEAERVLAPGGKVMSLDIAKGWYGGELALPVFGKPRLPAGTPDSQMQREQAFLALDYRRRFFYQTQVYDSLEHIVSTYGFIFGKKAIYYLKANNITSIKWKYVIHYKQVQLIAES